MSLTSKSNNFESMENSSPSSEIHRNWLHLPVDAPLTILKKLEASELLESAQFVSKSWYDLCKEPFLWQTIRIRIHELKGLTLEEIYNAYTIMAASKPFKKLYGMMCNAVDRSNGGLIALDIEDYWSPKLFSYIVSRSSKLKRLRLARCNISKQEMKEALEKLPCLEELELTLCFKKGEAAYFISPSCRSLTTFKLNMRNVLRISDADALAIAEHMPELRHLQLIGNGLTNVGLTAILDGCRHLQSVDLRACFQFLDSSGWKGLLERVKDVQLPSDSTDDYGYDIVVCMREDYGDLLGYE